MVTINTIVAILLLSAVSIKGNENAPIHPTKQFQESLNTTKQPNYLAFICKEETEFRLEIKGIYRDTNGYGTGTLLQANTALTCHHNKSQHWNFISINKTELHIFGKKKPLNMNEENLNYEIKNQNVSILSYNQEMCWKVCSSITNCSLPVRCFPDTSSDINLTATAGKSKPRSVALETSLGVLCLVLTIIAMILIIYIVREKKTQRTDASSGFSAGKHSKEALAAKNLRKLPNQQRVIPTNPEEHVYEDIDDFGSCTQLTRPKSGHESVNSLYGVAIH